MGNKHTVFVYGTLRDGEEPTHFLPGYAMVAYQGRDFKFPYAVPSGEYDIVGNLVEVDDKGLEQFDVYENVRSGLFVRKEVEVVDIDTNDSTVAWVYIAGPSLFNIVESGNWLEYLDRNN